MTKKPTYEELEQRIEELDQRESERKQAEEALRENEEKYRIVVENSSDAIRVFNETGHLYANRACLELLGYKWEELRAMDGWAVVAPECREWTRERGLKRLKGENISGRIEIPMLCKDGKKLTVEVMVNSIRT
ncbi:MAG: PAS domain S-box protein [Patescibacteria group bacterium]